MTFWNKIFTYPELYNFGTQSVLIKVSTNINYGVI